MSVYGLSTKRVATSVLACVLCLTVKPQATQKSAHNSRGIFYFTAGFFRVFYSTSTIHVSRTSEPLFNFKLKKVKARDDGSFRDAPQYCYAIGYYFTQKKLGIEYSFDHVKYLVRQNQAVRLEGNIEGRQYNQDTVINEDFFQLEHSDGGNYAMINFVRWLPLTSSFKKISCELILKLGAGVVIPKQIQPSWVTTGTTVTTLLVLSLVLSRA